MVIACVSRMPQSILIATNVFHLISIGYIPIGGNVYIHNVCNQIVCIPNVCIPIVCNARIPNVRNPIVCNPIGIISISSTVLLLYGINSNCNSYCMHCIPINCDCVPSYCIPFVRYSFL
jgi:hypothetical protein